MALMHKVAKRIDLEHEPGAWIEARLPSQSILERARQAQSRKAIQMMAGIDLSLFRGFSTVERTEDAPEYDWLTLLQSCIVAWSYPDPVTAENIAELDAVSVAAVMAALLPIETEAQRKNGSGGSMNISTGSAPARKSG